jgi:hypothetical protein
MNEQNAISQFIPTIELSPPKLPSGGKCYPRNVKVSYRGYLFGEIQNFNASKNLSLADILKRTLDGIAVSGMAKESLTFPDVLYIGVLRKLSSVGTSEFSIKHICKKCGTVNERRFGYVDLSFNDMEFEGEALELQLSNNKTFLLSPLTVGDVLKLKSGYASKFRKEDLSGDRIANFSIMVRNAEFDEVYKELYNLTDIDDRDALLEIDKIFNHDLKPLEVVCSNDKCKFEDKLVIEGREALIGPFRGGRTADRNRVRVIKRTEPQSLSHQVDGV